VVSADPERLGQVLANLLDNALRHTPAGGHVKVAATRAGSAVTLTVTDDGEGIPTEQIGSVFDRFHRVDAARTSTDGSGSGLGLTIARAIIADHGGTLTASSAGPGSGATFTVMLPSAT
jgi:signal transduction histidine kinase